MEPHAMRTPSEEEHACVRLGREYTIATEYRSLHPIVLGKTFEEGIDTCCGVGVCFMASPNPSCPSGPQPHEYSLPSRSKAKECVFPAAISTTFRREVRRRGVPMLVGEVLPNPNRPSFDLPHVKICPSEITTVCS